MDANNSISMATAFLEEKGLNLFGVLDISDLPLEIKRLFSTDIELSQYKRLIVMGNGGGKIWESLSSNHAETDNPIDTFSLQILELFCRRYLPEAKNQILYPSEKHIIPLQRIGIHLGWSSPSPLGIGISNKYGLWWAFRGALLTSAELKPTTLNKTSSPCDECLDKPCITHCPGSAVSDDQAFNIPACFNHRAKSNSSCLDRCLSRNACPIHQNNTYPTEMTKYIYKKSMKAVAKYVRQEN